MTSSVHEDATNRPGDPVVFEDRSGDARQPTLSELLSALSDDVTTLFRQEVELAKLEAKRELAEAGKAAGMLVAGAIAAFVTLLLLAWAASWALALVVPIWAGFLIVAVVFGALAAGLVVTGRKKLQQLDATPHQTIETLQEDKQMLTDRSNR